MSTATQTQNFEIFFWPVICTQKCAESGHLCNILLGVILLTPPLPHDFANHVSQVDRYAWGVHSESVELCANDLCARIRRGLQENAFGSRATRVTFDYRHLHIVIRHLYADKTASYYHNRLPSIENNEYVTISKKNIAVIVMYMRRTP